LRLRHRAKHRVSASAVLGLLEKLRPSGTPLGEDVDGKLYRGILTGLNEAFVLDRATRDRLTREHSSSAEILNPFLRGCDLKRWCAGFAEQFLIKIEPSENKDHAWSSLSAKESDKVFAKT
jgi:adenine-specific DNA-methyltransferase